MKQACIRVHLQRGVGMIQVSCESQHISIMIPIRLKLPGLDRCITTQADGGQGIVAEKRRLLRASH